MIPSTSAISMDRISFHFPHAREMIRQGVKGSNSQGSDGQKCEPPFLLISHSWNTTEIKHRVFCVPMVRTQYFYAKSNHLLLYYCTIPKIHVASCFTESSWKIFLLFNCLICRRYKPQLLTNSILVLFYISEEWAGIWASISYMSELFMQSSGFLFRP